MMKLLTLLRPTEGESEHGLVGRNTFGSEASKSFKA